ncbi:MAG: MarR family winged helix-turn-helix transcriptional regulator [Blastocatellia bacterium]
MSNVPETMSQEVFVRFAEGMFKLIIAHYQRQLVELDLTMVQAQVLRLIQQRKSLSIGEIATELGISAPAVTQLTDRLIRKRLIERKSAPEDRRSVLVGLSGGGKRAMGHFSDRRGDIFKEALEKASDADRKSALDAMSKILKILEGDEPETALSGKSAS